MESVTIDAKTYTAHFQVRPATPTPAGGPPVELILSGAGYREAAIEPGGYSLGGWLHVVPPAHTLIGSVCFVNRGRSTAVLDGSAEAGSKTPFLSRSTMTLGGRPVAGVVALTFLGHPQRALLNRLGEVFGHVSVVTDRLVPVWLVWLLAVLVALGVPLGVLVALYLALREDEAPATS